MACAFKHNVWGVDKVLRVVVWLALVLYACYSNNPWFYLWAIPLVTWLINFCPFYPLLKISTLKEEKK